jgi:hypothetical protein
MASDPPPHTDEPANVEYGEVQVDTSGVTQSRAAPEDIVAIANRAWKHVRTARAVRGDQRKSDALLLKEVQDEFRDLSQSFPLVVRWMVERGEYNSKAFLRYLKHHGGAPLKEREDFLRLQGEYLVQLARAKYPRSPPAFFARYRTQVQEDLLKEDKDFMETTKEVEADILKKQEAADAERKAALRQVLWERKRAAAAAAAGAEEGTAAPAPEASPAAEASAAASAGGGTAAAAAPADLWTLWS